MIEDGEIGGENQRLFMTVSEASATGRYSDSTGTAVGLFSRAGWRHPQGLCFLLPEYYILHSKKIRGRSPAAVG